MNQVVVEQALTIPCAGDEMLAILHRPQRPSTLGVVVIVGGPQYRAGSHRQFVQLARRLAGAGHAVLRFDVRGMGDSSGAARDFEQITPDIGNAIDMLVAQVPQVGRVVLWGLCDGASAALLYLDETHDCRVKGVCALNPWVRTPVSEARTRVKHYYTQRLRQRDFWLKLLRGGVGLKALGGLAGNVRDAAAGSGAAARSYTQRMAAAWRSFDGRLLLLLSGNDHTAREFLELAAIDAPWAGALADPKVRRVDIEQADHTLSDSAACRQAEDAVLAWLNDDHDGEPPQTRARLVGQGEYA